jgi:hypothetical protein
MIVFVIRRRVSSGIKSDVLGYRGVAVSSSTLMRTELSDNGHECTGRGSWSGLEADMALFLDWALEPVCSFCDFPLL